MSEANLHTLAATVVWGGFALGFVFGAVGSRTNFCTMGAVSDVVNMGDWNRMRMWLLAIAAAILGATALQLAGLIDAAKSLYLSPNLAWLSLILGGFLFGTGMTLASGCPSKNLMRLGAGNLKSLVVFLVVGISAYMTLKGVLGVFRIATLDRAAINLGVSQDLPTLAARAFGLDRNATLAITAAALAGALLAFVFRSREFRNFDNILGGVVVGLAVVGGWYLSGHLGYLTEDPTTLEERFLATSSGRMESLSFVAPQAYLLELLMLWSDKSRVVTFGIASALGVFSGSLVYALATRTWRLEAFTDARDLISHLAGAALMGFGGVLALGCTIGQGLSGLSMLSLGSMLAFGSIIAGAALTMKWLYWRMLREA